MLEKIKDFYIKYSPTFTDRYKKYSATILTSKYVNDIYSNIAIVDKTSDLISIKNEFIEKNLEPIFYSFSEMGNNFESVYIDDFLYFDDIENLYNKYKKFKRKDLTLTKVDSTETKKDYIEINDLCYSADSYDNPYSNLDNIGYSKAVLDFQANEKETKTLVYIIKHKEKSVGCINLTIKDDWCYISGLAILQEYRKTKIFFSMIDILKILIDNNIKTIFCVTELNEYPDRLYKKLGFKSVGIGYAFKEK